MMRMAPPPSGTCWFQRADVSREEPNSPMPVLSHPARQTQSRSVARVQTATCRLIWTTLIRSMGRAYHDWRPQVDDCHRGHCGGYDVRAADRCGRNVEPYESSDPQQRQSHRSYISSRSCQCLPAIPLQFITRRHEQGFCPIRKLAARRCHLVQRMGPSPHTPRSENLAIRERRGTHATRRPCALCAILHGFDAECPLHP